jgi:hypothetical protein
LLSVAVPKDWRAPNGIDFFYEDVVSRFLLPPEIIVLLSPADTADIQMNQLMQAFKLFPLDREKLITLILSKRSLPKGSETDEVLFRMFGMENTRNFVVAIAVFQLVTGQNFEWHRDLADPKVQPSQLLQFAVKAQAGYQGRLVDLAFLSGLCFDILLLIANRLRPKSPKIKSYITQVFEQGLRETKAATEISRKLNDLKSSDYVYCLSILAGVGKAVAAILDENSIHCFNSEIKDGLPRSFEALCEEKLYGVSSDFYGAEICSYFPSLKPIQLALYFLRKPYLLKHQGHLDLANLVMAVCLARQMDKHSFPLLKDPEDPVFTVHCTSYWLIPEVRDLKLTGKDLFKIAQVLSES